jgi:alpha-glucosidase
MAAFTPFFRIHSALMTPHREPWEFEAETLDGIRSILNLRYALLPYIYTLAWEASQSGAPLMRPMFWTNPTDSSLWNIDDQFLLGDAVLVAPIVEPGATSRKIHLPEGIWFDYRDDQRYEGNQTVSTEAALQRIPLFIRGGAVLPMKVEGFLELHIYLPHDGIQSSQLYSDEGDGYVGSRMDRFRLETQGESVSLKWENEGDYAFPYPEIKIIPHGFELIKPIIDGKTIVCDPEFLVTGMFRNAEFQGKTPP